MSLHDDITTNMHRIVDGQASDIITPASLALAVQAEYVDGRLESHIEYTSLEHLKQIARSVLSGRYSAESDESEAHQGELFSGHLQTRYPVPRKRGDEPAYKLREALTADEVKWNVDALRKSAESRLLHADALEAWDQSRQAAA